VDATGDVGCWGNSIAIDNTNKVHISYLDNTNKILKYATNPNYPPSGAWSCITADNGLHPTVTTCNFTGVVQQWVVPTGVTSIQVDVKGAQGGNGFSGTPGNGGRVQTTLPVTPTETLNIYVGGAGGTNASGWNGGGSGGGPNGGGGGGGSDIRRTPYALANRLVVAGGGGGCGIANGGNGGYPNGGDGANNFGTGGGGGTQSAGGAAGTGGDPGFPGGSGTGGNGSPSTGGGGGGGYYGGGGGGNASGGGGGSCTSTGTSTTYTNGYQTGNGQIVITYTASAMVGYISSIAVDSNRKVHISYSDATNKDLKYANNVTAANFTSWTIDSAGDLAAFTTSIAIDNAAPQNVHISYADGTNYLLKYVKINPANPGAAIPETADSTGNLVIGSSIATDTGNNPHIGYLIYSTTNSPKYVKRIGGWSARADAGLGYCGSGGPGGLSLCLDANNNVHMGYNQPGTVSPFKKLRYVTNKSGLWVESVLESTNNVLQGGYQYTTDPMVLDSNNIAHFCYRDIGASPAVLKYVRTYSYSGSLASSPITPTDVSYWGVLRYSVTSPTYTTLTIDVLNSADNSLLVANVLSGTNLYDTYPAAFSGITGIKLRANFATDNTGRTPTLSDWNVDYLTGKVITTTNWTSMIPAGKSVAMGQSIAHVKFDMKTTGGTANWKKFRIDKGVTGVATPVPDNKIEVQVWMENSNNGFWDVHDTLIAKGNFTNGICYLNMNRWQVTTTTKTYYIVYKLANDIGGGQRAGVKIADSSYLEFENATAVGVPP
jgi:hypothetical protein